MKKQIVSHIMAGVLSLTLLFSAGCGAGQNTGSENNTESTVSSVGEADSSSQSSEDDSTSGETSYPLTVTDDLGNEVTIEKEPERVVSLSPANTETLFAIGAGERVVGRTDYCDYPAEAAEIESIGSYSTPNTELIISMTPDVVFASDYIDDSIRSQIEGVGAAVVVFSANDVDSVEKNIETAGQIMNLNDEASGVTDEMTAQLEEIKAAVADRSGEKSAFIDLGSYYSSGTGSLLGNMLNDLGIKNIAEDTGEMWPQLSVEKIIESNPDIYISLYTTPEELKQVSGLSDMECIKNDSIIFYDGLSEEADIIQRAGPRLVEGTKLLAEQIFPESFS